MLGDTMYNLQNNPILTPYQTKVLKVFFSTNFSQSFFLTGGTALSPFYLAHRESQDLDLFSLENFDSQQLTVTIQDLARQTNSVITTKVTSPTYHEIYLENKTENGIQRLDFVREQPKHFGNIQKIEGVAVDSLENIGSNKVLGILGRLEPKDYVDLYFVVTKTEWTFDQLFDLAKQKDTGLSEFYFANIIAEAASIQNWPLTKIPFSPPALISYYEDLAHTLLLKIKPVNAKTKATLASLK